MRVGRFKTMVLVSEDALQSFSWDFDSILSFRLSYISFPLRRAARFEERTAPGYYRPHPQPVCPSRSRSYFPTHMARVPFGWEREVGSCAGVSFSTPLFVMLAITSFYLSCLLFACLASACVSLTRLT